MFSTTWPGPSTDWSRTLAGAEFGEYHSRVMDADADRVWDALLGLCWTDLRLGKIMLWFRGLGVMVDLSKPWLETFAPRAVVVEDRPRSVAFVMIGRPWSVVPKSWPVDSLPQVAAFDRPGWLKYGMEWVLTPLPDGRTVVETRTLCEPTSRSARLRFGAYWSFIRAGSAALRREILRTVARRASRESP